MQGKSAERRGWTQAEDTALKQLYESVQLNRWSLIAQQLQIYGFVGRTGKQCRERYNNQLDPKVCHQEWQLQQEKRLYHLHDELGNKWAVISHRLGGRRTDNSVKNHYYSRLRKSLRKLNKIIHHKYKKMFREIQTKVLYKIIEASQEKFKAEPMVDRDMSDWGCDIKNKILMFSYDEEEEEAMEDQEFRGVQLINEINEFNKNYKRKPKRFRKLGAPNLDMLDNIDSDEVRQRVEGKDDNNPQEAENIAGSSFFLSPFKCSFQEQQIEVQDDNNSHKNIKIQQKKMIFPIILTGQPKLQQKTQKQQIANSGHQMVGSGPQILEQLGLLQDDMRMPPHPMLIRKPTSQMSSDHQSNEQFKFFEDSSLDFRLCAPPLLSNMKKESIDEDGLFH